MKRKLIQQILNQWRSNIWLVLQLVIVSCVIFYIGTGLYFHLANYFAPFGYRTGNTYQIVLSQIPEGGEGYVADIDRKQRIDDIMAIIDRLKSMDEVEALAYSRWAGPYQANYYGMFFNSIAGADTLQIYGNYKKISPEYIKVFGLRSTDGTSSEQMAQLLSEGKLLVSKEVLVKGLKDKDSVAELLKSRVFQNDYDSIEYRIGAIVESTKRFDFDGVTPVIYSLYPPQETRFSGMPEISVRIKPNVDGEKFMQTVRDLAASHLFSRNVYVRDVMPYESVKEGINLRYNKEIVQYVACILFLLINIFLGLLGVFWFRTRQRTSEIALRKSFGATSASIFRRLVSEGLLLLAVALPFVTLIDWLLAKHQFTADYILSYKGIAFAPERFLAPIGATALVMALMIAIGISIPAWRAMRTVPSQALHEE